MGPVRGAGCPGSRTAVVSERLSVWDEADPGGAVVVGTIRVRAGGPAGAAAGRAADVDAGRVRRDAGGNRPRTRGTEGSGRAYHDDVAGCDGVHQPGTVGEPAGYLRPAHPQ